MAQIIIIAPAGEDVSAAEQALKDAGHDVETVEATPLNLMNLATGMLEGADAKPEKKEKPAEEEGADKGGEEELPPPAELEAPSEEPPKNESLGRVEVDGELIPAYRGLRSKLFVTNIAGIDRVTYSINESKFSFWREGVKPRVSVSIIAENGGANAKVLVGSAAKRSFIVLDPKLQSQLKLA